MRKLNTQKIWGLITLIVVFTMLFADVGWALIETPHRPQPGTSWSDANRLASVAAEPGLPSSDSNQVLVDQADADIQTNSESHGRLLFAPTIDLDGDPATNPVANVPVPILQLLDEEAGIITLAAQLEPDDAQAVPVGIPVTFRLRQGQATYFEQTVRSDAWGAASVEIPIEDIDLFYSYEASAPGYGRTETRTFRFDPGQKSYILHTDRIQLSRQQQSPGEYLFTLHSPVPLDTTQDEVTLIMTRKPILNGNETAVSPLHPIFEAIDDAGLSLPLPTIPMAIVDAHTAQAEVQLPPGDYGVVGLLTINNATIEHYYSQSEYFSTTETTATTSAKEIVWASLLEYESGQTLVQYEAAGKFIFDLVNSDELPAVREDWEGHNELIKTWRTGPFEWREEHYDVSVETIVNSGGKVVSLQDFDYDPISRRYTVAIESLQDRLITDTLRIEVFGPDDVLIHYEEAQVVLDPERVLHYTFEVPAGVGQPHSLRIVLDNPFQGIIQNITSAARTLNNAVRSGQGSFSYSVRFFAEALGITILQYEASVPGGGSGWSWFPNSSRLGFIWEVTKWLSSSAWDVSNGRFTLGRAGLEHALSAGVSFTVDKGKCPDPAAIPRVEQRVNDLATELDRAAENLKLEPDEPIVTPPLPVFWVVLVWGRLSVGVEGDVGASGLSITFSARGTLGSELHIGVGVPAADYATALRQLGTLYKVATAINGLAAIVHNAGAVAGWQVPQEDCDPDPPDPRPPDDRQDVWQGVESFYQAPGDQATIDNLTQLIQQAQAQDLWRAERLLVVRLREADLARFHADIDRLDGYIQDVAATTSEAAIEIEGIISGTVPISPSLAITEAVVLRLEQMSLDLETSPYKQEQQQLTDALEVADRLYLELRGEELELQQELRQLLTADAVGVVATGFAEATLSALDAAGLPAQLVSLWPSDGEFRGQPSPYFAPGLAPRALVVPSGAMHTIANSPEAQDWLEAYVRGGGLLLVFTQAFGMDWEALPGGEVTGVGYEEDRRWQHATVEAAVPSDWLVWMGIERPDIQVDGAFTGWPANANILLRRTFGTYAGYPVMLEYPYGNGRVLATSAYGDWAWQAGFWWGDDWQMTRSLLNRAYLLGRGQDVGDVFAADPASTVTVSFPVTNMSAFTITEAVVTLPIRLGYWGRDYSQTVPLTLAPGESGVVNTTLSTPPVRRGVHSWTQVGLYRLTTSLRDVRGDTYNVAGPFVYVRSPVNPPALAIGLEAGQVPANLFQTTTVSATVRNFTNITRTVTISSYGDLPATSILLDVPPQDTAVHTYSLHMDGSKTPAIEVFDDENNIVGRSSLNINIAYPQLEATPVVPSALADTAVIPVRVTNEARQGAALAASLTLTLTNPAGTPVWVATQPLPSMAAGQTVTPTFTLSLPDLSLGTYRLHYRTDDGRGLYRESHLPISSRLALENNLDRASYHIRQSGTLTVTLNNSGRFDLAPTVTISATALGLADNQPLSLPVGTAQTLTYAFTLSENLSAGSYPIEVSYQVGDDVVTQIIPVTIPAALIRPSLEQQEYMTGDTIALTLANRGGVDAPVTATLQLGDDRGLFVAETIQTPTVPAAGSSVITLTIPGGAAGGLYQLLLNGENADTGVPFSRYDTLTVNGVSAGLTVQTGQPAYFSDEPVQALASANITAGNLTGGNLNLRICTPLLEFSEPLPPPPPVPSDLPPALMEIDLTDTPFRSYLYTVGDVVLFSYTDGSELSLYQTDGTLIWQDILDAGQRQLVNVAAGTYLATGSQKFAVLGGDPIANGVASYYATDQDGFGVSQELYTWTQTSYFPPNERFIVFAYTDNTSVTVADADTGDIYWSGVLDDGQHWATNTLHNRWLHITADNPVSAYTHYDQGSLVPAANGRWSGTLFYTYAGLIGPWENDVNVMAFEDNTQITIQDSESGELYWTGMLDSGQIHTEGFGGSTPRGDAYLTISSDKTVAVTVAPFESFTTAYHHGFYAPDASGSRIGTDIIAHTMTDGLLQVFAYSDETTVEVYNSLTDQLINIVTLDTGESLNVNPGYGVWRLRSNKPVSAWSGWGQWAAEFAPVLFGSIVEQPAYETGCGFVLWEENIPVTATTTFEVEEIVDPLNVTGRLLLDGRLFAATGQQLAHDNYPFYLFDHDTALTIATDRQTYRPGDNILVSGWVTNTTALTESLTLVVADETDTYLVEPLTLAPGEGYPYNTTLIGTSSLTLTATAANALASTEVIVADPQVTAELTAPDLAGHDPFSVTLTLTNTGIVTTAIETTLAGQPGPALTLQPGEVALVNRSVQIVADTLISATVSGDVSLTLSQAVVQGELATLALQPPATNLAGLVAIPYLLDSTGLLPVSGQLQLWAEADGELLAATAVAALSGEHVNGGIVVDLPAGRHTLTGRFVDNAGNLIAQTELEILLLASDRPALPDIRTWDVTVAPDPVAAGDALAITLNLVNDGAAGPIIVGLQLFDPQQQWIITPTAHQSQSITFNLNVPADLPSDAYFGEITVAGESRPFVANVIGSDIEMSLSLDRAFYQPDDIATLTVTLTDRAGLDRDYIIMSRYISAEDYYTATVPANQTVTYTFSFTTTETARTTVFLSNTPTPTEGQRVLMLDSLPVPVIQEDQGAYLTFDKLVYDPGETASITAAVTGQIGNLTLMGPMELALQDSEFLFWQPPRKKMVWNWC